MPEQHRIVDLLVSEDERRRKLFAKASTDSFSEYNRSNRVAGGAHEPAIVVFIDRMAQIRESLDDEHLTRLTELIHEGSGRGIFFIVTAMNINEVPVRLRACFRGIALQSRDRGDCAEIVGRRMPPEMADIAAVSGRGLALQDDVLYEIQIALFGTETADVVRALQLEQLGNEMRVAWTGASVPSVPRIPDKPTFLQFSADAAFIAAQGDPWTLPVAYNALSGTPEIVSLDSNYSFLISGARHSGRTNMLMLLGEIFKARGAQVHVVGGEAWEQTAKRLDILRYDVREPAWEAFVKWLDDEIATRNRLRKEAMSKGQKTLNDLARSFEPIVLLLDDLDLVIENNHPTINKRLSHISSMADKYGLYLFASVSHQGYLRARLQEPLNTLALQQRGIALGGRLTDCDPWNVLLPSTMKKLSLPRGEALLIQDGEARRIVIPRVMYS